MEKTLKFTVLSDNIASEGLESEWGLSIYIEYGARKILLDTGASELYLVNAQKLGINLSEIELAVLSHAHYDHANGMPAFFGINHSADFYLSSGCSENCYALKPETGMKYIGIPKNTLCEFRGRIQYVQGKTQIAEGITLLTHTTPGMTAIAENEKLYVELDGVMQPDNFSHEQSLIFEIPEGLVIFNSCCHAGAANIIHEVSDAFPGKNIAALIGGFHLYNRSREEVFDFAEQLRTCGVAYICTGHCTGDAAYKILAEDLGPVVHQLHCGLVHAW